MSYAARVANLGRPGCYGEIAEYDGESRDCRGCAFRHDCEQSILSKQSRLSSPRTAPQYQTYQRSPLTPTPPVGGRPITPVTSSKYTSAPTYNFEKPLLEQVGVYVATSMAEALLFEAQHLVVAIRENYRSRV